MTATNVTSLPVAQKSVDDGTIDRAFVLQMAQVPFIAAILVFCAWIGHTVWASVASPNSSLMNHGPIIVVCLGMILAAIIDGWAFKVPNWLTLSLVVSGWVLGGLHDLNMSFDAGRGGFGSALIGTGIGFICLFPMLAIGGMGQGDVKMQMGFGSWIGAFYGYQEAIPMVFYAFAAGAIVGGVFALVMMALRRNIHKNLSNFKEIGTDLKVLVTHGPSKAAERANERRSSWVRLPYGVPLCVGFLGYLTYLYMTNAMPTWTVG
ncbi:prepilin peptidase [Telmatocola sphagniphila]|uniref:Prepilin peptidase n=2 Tax=Telmatocola sphagniphila TaxID=1123043 RepID=A0A8E6BBJ3_9BACT|nr:prepilin peptidase [Telmatocola sphagniphila]